MTQYDKHRQQLEHDLMAGVICNKEYAKQMREIELDERQEMLDEAQQAYDNVLDRAW